LISPPRINHKLLCTCGYQHGIVRKERSDSLPRRPRCGCEMSCGELQDSTSRRNSGIANRLDVILADGRLGTTQGRAAAEDSWVEFGSRRLLKRVSDECLLLFSRQEFEGA
jgi:hypothetical protein